MNTSRIIRNASKIVVVFLLAGLLGWYFFISKKTASIETVDTGRGFAASVPSFSSAGGSTFSNILSGVGISEENTPTSASERLRLVLATPVAGFTFVRGGNTLRFMERSTGYIFETSATGTPVRLTHTLIPKVYEAVFFPDNSLIAQSVDARGERTVFSAKMGTTTENNLPPLVTTPLSSALVAAVADSSGRVISLFANSQGSVLTASSGKETRNITQLGISRWNIFAPGNIFIAEKTGSNIAGNAYRVSEDGSLSPVARNIPGLLILPHASTSALVYSSDAGTPSLFGRTSVGTKVTFPIKTVAEKCVWGRGTTVYCAVPNEIPANNFLDAWYAGTLHTSDSWWKLDVESGTAELLYSPLTEKGLTLDVENPIIDPRNEFILFRNARDKSLWILRIEQ